MFVNKSQETKRRRKKLNKKIEEAKGENEAVLVLLPDKLQVIYLVNFNKCKEWKKEKEGKYWIFLCLFPKGKKL